MSTTAIDLDSLTPLHWLAIVLSAISGVIHLFLGIKYFALEFLPISFILAGLGFFGAIALFLLDIKRQLLYLVGIPFVGLQIVLFAWINLLESGDATTAEAIAKLGPIYSIDMIDKIAQIALIVVLGILYRQSEGDEETVSRVRDGAKTQQ